MIFVAYRGSTSEFRFGSVAIIHIEYSQMAALGRKAETEPGRMAALTNTGRSMHSNLAITNGS